jgi:hypothetical protein
VASKAPSPADGERALSRPMQVVLSFYVTSTTDVDLPPTCQSK